MIKTLGLALGLAVLTGCGADHPLVEFGNPLQTPSLVLPVADTVTLGSVSNYNSSNRAFTFSGSAIATVRAPAEGVVIRQESASDGVAVTLYVSGGLQIRVGRMASSSLRAGDRVVAGQDLGLTAVSGVFDFAVFEDGNAVCPYSFLDTSGRARVDVVFATPCT